MKNTREIGTVLVVSATLAGVWSVWAEPATFSRLGALPGNFPANTVEVSRAAGISPDGSTVVGSAFDPIANRPQAAFWTRTSGLVNIGSIQSNGLPTNAVATAASLHGNVIVGTSNPDFAASQAFRWTSLSNRIEALDSLPGNTLRFSTATDIDQLGNTIVGGIFGLTNTFSVPYRWTQASGFRPIALPPSFQSGTAATISKDGSHIFGQTDYSIARAIFGWSDPLAGGSGSFILDARGTLNNYPFDTSTDGYVTVGVISQFAWSSNAFLWTDPSRGGAGLELLPTIPDGESPSSLAVAVSDDAKIVVGMQTTATNTFRPFIWTLGRSSFWLSDYFADNGLSTPGFRITSVDGISSDGQFLVGNGLDLSTGRTEGWHAFIPRCFADFNDNGLIDFFDYLDFVQAFDAGNRSSDFNGNGTVDFFDYLDFVVAYDAGC